MSNTDTAGSWERIQSGVRETERLLGQKKYNMAMVKARQTLEFMVKCLCEQNGVMETGLVDMIDTLYEEGIISKTTSEHYHKIRMIGNKAIHEENNTAYDANQAHHLLSQEVYTFANDYGSKRKKTASRNTSSRTSSSRQASGTSAASGRSARTEQSGRSNRSARSSSSSRSRRKEKKPAPIGPQDIIKLLIPIGIIILLIIIIRMVAPEKKEVPKVTEATSVAATMEDSTETVTEPVTEETTAEPVTVVYKTTSTLNVRSKPSTTDSSVLTQLAPDTTVSYIRDENEEWAVIDYNGQEAYVSKEYLKKTSE